MKRKKPEDNSLPKGVGYDYSNDRWYYCIGLFEKRYKCSFRAKREDTTAQAIIIHERRIMDFYAMAKLQM